jgi:hypothetical protein
MHQIFTSLRQRYAALFSSYSDHDLAFILDYIIHSSAVMQEATAQLRQEAKSAGRSKPGMET